MARFILPSVAFAAIVAWCLAAQEPKKEPAKPAVVRKPWTTSKVVGSPDPPPPFKAVRVFPEVKFKKPLLIANCPGTERLFVGEHEGAIFSIKPGPEAKAELFFDIKKDVRTIDKLPGAKEVETVYGLVFHPQFEQNRYCYVCYTLRPKDGKVKNLPDGSRVSRFTVTKTEPPRIDPASEEIVITFPQGGHNGGDLHFGPDGMLYISTGDGGNPNPPDPLNTGQDCSDLLSSVLRIDVDHPGEPKGVSPRVMYSIPKDNPFVGMANVRPEIWAFGFRNPWRMSFDKQTGDLWLGDVGWELWEMVHKVEKGGNYGWSIVEARQPIKPDQKPGPTPIRPPLIELPHTIAASVTGGYVYRGKKFPELFGAYIFGDWETRRIWAARFEGDRLKEMPEIVKPSVRVVAFGEDHAGELYFADYDSGLLYTFERNDAGVKNAKFPTKLSETGIFKDGTFREVADGVIRFNPNSTQWQDGATSMYGLALPGLSTVSVFDKPRPLPGQVYWHDFKMQFPKDAVLVKMIRLPLVDGKNPMIETQILHFDGEDWHGYSYAWRDDQSDADLVPADGAEKVYEVIPDRLLPHQKREQVWTFHSRTQCMSCHSAWSEYTLSFNPRQLNRHTAEKDRFNELVELSQEGYIRRVGERDKELPPFDDASASKEPALPWPFVGTAPLEDRVRSYLHTNCAHCHRFGGGGGQVVLELDYSKTLKETGIFDVRPKQGDFGIPNARLVAPGDPERSVLYYRMAKFGRGRMPHLGSEVPDPRALELMHEWIRSLDGRPAVKPPTDLAGLDKGLSTTDGALPFARGLSIRSFPERERDKILAAAAKLPPGPVRDLFEGYLPADPKGRRIGSNPRPASILAMNGDAKRGEAIFFTESMQCAKCHKMGEKGIALGPDLTAIGKTRTKPELLDSILQPSAKVEPQFASYLVKTVDGRSFTGLLVKRDDKQVILRDAENKEIVLAAANVDAVQPSRLSLMPDGLVAGLTPQEAADLLEFLATRK